MALLLFFVSARTNKRHHHHLVFECLTRSLEFRKHGWLLMLHPGHYKDRCGKASAGIEGPWQGHGENRSALATAPCLGSQSSMALLTLSRSIDPERDSLPRSCPSTALTIPFNVFFDSSRTKFSFHTASMPCPALLQSPPVDLLFCSLPPRQHSSPPLHLHPIRRLRALVAPGLDLQLPLAAHPQNLRRIRCLLHASACCCCSVCRYLCAGPPLLVGMWKKILKGWTVSFQVWSDTAKWTEKRRTASRRRRQTG